MKNDLLQLIQDLTNKDTKTLSQKGLKASEEVGELAKAILPYDNAAGTRHRFTTSEKILEEVADINLVTMSIAFELGYGYNDIIKMMEKKAAYWAELQKQDLSVKDGIPFEIHITLKDIYDLVQFKRMCVNLEVKPIVLDLHTSNNVIQDMMISYNFVGNNGTVYQKAKYLETCLKNLGYEPIRTKIETVPWHPMSPKTETDVMPKNCYFESHLGIVVNDINELKFIETYCIPRFKKAISSFPKDMFAVKVSSNAFKGFVDGRKIYMVTLRSYTSTKDVFEFAVSTLKIRLASKFKIEKEIIEFSIYDSNVNHDYRWLNE